MYTFPLSVYFMPSMHNFFAIRSPVGDSTIRRVLEVLLLYVFTRGGFTGDKFYLLVWKEGKYDRFWVYVFFWFTDD